MSAPKSQSDAEKSSSLPEIPFPERGPEAQQLAQGLGPVAAAHFFFRGHFGGGEAQLGIEENGIVAEAVFAARGAGDAAFPGAGSDEGVAFGRTDGDDAAEARRTVPQPALTIL